MGFSWRGEGLMLVSLGHVEPTLVEVYFNFSLVHSISVSTVYADASVMGVHSAFAGIRMFFSNS